MKDFNHPNVLNLIGNIIVGCNLIGNSIDINLLTAIMSRVATLISASSKDHMTLEYHVMCLVFCVYSTLYSVQYGEILLS